MEQTNPIEVLLVEDNPQDAELIVRVFKKLNLSRQLFVVKDGVEALDFIFARGRFTERQTDQHPKVVMLDVKLPRLNGLEVLRALKSDERMRKIPVVMLTSSKQDPDIQTSYKLGANSYVVKPVSYESFEETITQLCRYWLLVNQPHK